MRTPRRLLRLAAAAASALAVVILTVASPPITPASAAAPDGAGAAGEKCVPLQRNGGGQIHLSKGRVANYISYDAGHGISARTRQLPTNWSPITASDTDLATLGFPARPKDLAGLAAWKNDYRNFKGTDPHMSQQLCRGSVKFGSIGTESTSNYVGLNPTNKTFKGAYATLALPPTNLLVCPHSSTDAFWVGTADDSTSYIDQTGIVFDPSNSSGYQYWSELFPLDPIYANNGNDMSAWTSGQPVKINESYSSSNGGSFTFDAYNISLGIDYSIDQVNAASYYRSADAEFINEQVGTWYVRKYGTAYWTGARVVYSDGTVHYPTTPDYYTDTSYFATQGASSSGNFNQTWKSC